MLLWIALALGILVASIAAGMIACAGIWRRTAPDVKALVKQIVGLRFANKLRLARALALDKRLPLRARMIPPGLVLYLALPIDIIPDFIPVIGYLDDVVVLVVGVGLLLRMTPRSVLEGHLSSFT